MRRQESLYTFCGKRLFDLFAALLGLLLIWPLLLALYCIMRISVGSPVLFRQQRPGLRAKPFTILKLRTMTNARGANGDLLPNEKRITRVGKIMRAWSLDELPEIFNVLRGDLSLVGPRPLRMHYLPRYSPEQARRHDVMPGITGWAQVNGRNAMTWEKKFELDVWYVDHQSFLLDLRILLLTAWKVVRREGINEEGYISASDFMGTPPGEPADTRTRTSTENVERAPAQSDNNH